MYKVEVDKAKKMIKMVITGFLKVDEVKTLSDEILNSLNQFRPKEAVLYADLRGFKPATPEVLPILQNAQAKAADHCRKFATIHDSAITQLQAKRAAGQTQANDSIERFKTEEEVLKYLFG